jgi:hypothetical protein
MLVDASRRGVDFFWFWIILLFQPLGAWAYFFAYKAGDLHFNQGWLAGLFHRRPSVSELRHRVERSPTLAARLELGERLVEVGEPALAVPLLEAVLAREPEHCLALFLLAESHRGLGHHEQAVPPLQKLIKRQSTWRDYKAWHTLIEVRRETGDVAGALDTCRELHHVAPSLQHRCLLAEHLLETGEKVEAGKIIQEGLDDYRFMTGLAHRRNRRWVSKAKQLLKQIG